MKISFLGQGFEDKSVDAVGNYLMNFLGQKDFDSFTGMSAFASESGVYGLAHYLNTAKNNFKNLNLIVGVDLEGTSKEALEEILALNINSYVFYQKEQSVFHPKIYLFEGAKEFRVIIGSSNLTRGGLFTNVESSMMIEFNSSDKEGLSLLAELKGYYKSLFDFSDPNLFKITANVIADFYADGIIPDEATRRSNFHKKTLTASTLATTVTKKASIQKRTTAKVPSSFPSKVRKAVAARGVASTSSKINTAQATTHAIVSSQPKVLLWESGSLTQRDLNIPIGVNTNQTGSMLLKKGITVGIDQKTYFRNQVFSTLAWTFDTAQSTSHLERATALFRIIILGVDHGVFSLLLSHNTKTNTKTYLQNNSMTSLSWRKAKTLIANSALIGRSASLFTDPTALNQFILEIN